MLALDQDWLLGEVRYDYTLAYRLDPATPGNWIQMTKDQEAFLAERVAEIQGYIDRREWKNAINAIQGTFNVGMSMPAYSPVMKKVYTLGQDHEGRSYGERGLVAATAFAARYGLRPFPDKDALTTHNYYGGWTGQPYGLVRTAMASEGKTVHDELDHSQPARWQQAMRDLWTANLEKAKAAVSRIQADQYAVTAKAFEDVAERLAVPAVATGAESVIIDDGPSVASSGWLRWAGLGLAGAVAALGAYFGYRSWKGRA